MIHNRLLSGLLPLFLVCVFTVSAQNYAINYRKIGTDDGLSSLNVLNLAQNSNGVMHVTTENGVFLFDGYTFNAIRTDSIGRPQIIGSAIKSPAEIFLSTRENGIYEYNYKTRSGFNYNPKGFRNTADYLLVKDHFIYLLTAHVKLDIINTKTNSLIEDEIKKVNKNNQAYCMTKTREGKIFIGRQNGLYEVTGNRQVKLDLLNNLPVYCIYEGQNGEIVAAAGSKIYFIKNGLVVKEISPKYKSKAFTFLPGGERNIHKLVIDKYNRIWFTTYPNENLYVYENGITHDLFEEVNITPLLINQLYKDKEENIWLATFDDGIYIFQNSYLNNVTINLAEKVLSVNKILMREQYVFTATNNGLYAYNTINNNIKVISKPDNILMEPITDVMDFNSIIYYTKRSQFDLNQSLFIDAKSRYLFKPIHGKLIQPLSNGQVIICDWMANVLLANKEASKIIDTLISFPDYRISITSVLSNGDSLLVATGKGLYYYSFKTKSHQLIEKTSNKRINHVANINGEIYVCHDEGIEMLNGTKEFKYLGNKPLNGVKKIYNHEKHLWILSIDGLIICDENFNPVKIINKQHGLPSNNINDISFESDLACISTSKGISYARTEELFKINTSEPVSVEWIRVGNQIIYFNNALIPLQKDDDDVSIGFYSPQFNQSNKQYFRYKINNGSWIPLETNSLNLPSLEGGKHQIQFIVSQDNINWSQPAQINLEKEAKFTETQHSYWIIIISSLSIISFISYLIIKRVKNRALNRIKEEQQINIFKHQAMNSLLSPHFIFNSLTSIQNYINSNNSLKASEYLAKFSRLIRMIIEKASQGQITLKDEITRLTYYLELEKERFKNKFDYVINIDEKIDQNTVSIPNMIIQPHAENCIIHGILPKMEHGHLHISFVKNGEKELVITIEDDGIGLIKAKEHAKTGHKSLGTSTIRNILDLNSKLTGKKQSVEMVDKSTLGTGKNGTLITIHLEL